MNENPVKTLKMQIHITNDRLVFGAVVVCVFVICILLYPLSGTFIGKLFTADYGIFNNLTVMIFLLCAAINAQVLTAYCKHSTVMILLCLFMIGEELEWLVPLDAKALETQQIRTVKDIIIACFGEVPDNAGLEFAMLIAAGRFLLIALPLYALAFLAFYRKPTFDYLEKSENSRWFFYVTAVTLLLLLSICCRGTTGLLVHLVEKAANFCVSAGMLLYTLAKLSPQKDCGTD